MSWSSSGAERIQTMYGGYCICLVRLISQLSKALDWPMEISAFVQNSWSESKGHLSPYVHAFIRWYILFAINFFHCPQPTYQDIYRVTKSSHSHLKYSAPQLSSSNSPWETLLNTQTSSICKERAKFIASREGVNTTKKVHLYWKGKWLLPKSHRNQNVSGKQGEYGTYSSFFIDHHFRNLESDLWICCTYKNRC